MNFDLIQRKLEEEKKILEKVNNILYVAYAFVMVGFFLVVLQPYFGWAPSMIPAGIGLAVGVYAKWYESKEKNKLK